MGREVGYLFPPFPLCWLGSGRDPLVKVLCCYVVPVTIDVARVGLHTRFLLMSLQAYV